MRCLVTGASGHLGSYLTRHLLDQGEEVSILVRPQSNLWRLEGTLDRVRILQADLAHLSAIENEFMDAAPKVVFHLAWSGVTKEARNDSTQIYENLIGSLDLFRLTQAAGATCWIGIGSQAEQGPPTSPLTEVLTSSPKTAYGVAKLCTRMLTEKLAEISKVRFVWFRLSAIFGPKSNDTYLIPTVIRDLFQRRTPVLTPGEQKWDYLYVEDAAEALYQAAIHSKVHGIYDLGSGKAQTVRHTVESIRDKIDPSLPLQFGGIPYLPDETMRLEMDISRFREATGWSPRVELEEGLEQTIEWHRNHIAAQSRR